MAPRTWFVTGALSGIGRPVTEQLPSRRRVPPAAAQRHHLHPAAELDSARHGPLVNLLLLTPVEIANAVSSEMTARGNGGSIVTDRFTGADPRPGISGLGPATAGTRNSAFSPHSEIAPEHTA